MTITGYIQSHQDGVLTVVAPLADEWILKKQEITECEIHLDDGRSISADQRRKIFALVRDITEWMCAPGSGKRARVEIETLRQMQLLYLVDYADTEAVRYQLTQHYCRLMDVELFSLSDVDMSTARDFIDWLVELCVVHGIPCIDTLLNRCEDIERYVYSCLMNKRCCITGKRAQLHHVDTVGRGRNRRDIIHLGMKALPLCLELHSEAHTIGQKSFERKYHVTGIVVDDEICKVWRLNRGKNQRLGR